MNRTSGTSGTITKDLMLVSLSPLKIGEREWGWKSIQRNTVEIFPNLLTDVNLPIQEAE